ncbi:hypothetical protein [Methylorubrum extorquens]|uniref:hypothetical protein n=1 Tax=Methylorubrum extorquens TaxID=408 RepID=UPI0020A1A1CB|nr:hypothetical protein [Methylorubrum extorquens]MCP1540088.1 hypothetical protein [Methylorubrum extorquens]
MHMTHADLCAIYARMTPAERAEAQAEARSKGVEVHELLARAVESLIQGYDRQTVAVLKSWHTSAERPSAVVSSV